MEHSLQCGTLSGWLGTTQQLDVQEAAKDLISQAEHAFRSRGNSFKVSEAQYELGMCYWRCGAFSEARVVLDKALENLEDTELRAKILIRKTLIEISTGRYHEAWNILDVIKPSFESLSDELKGRWHGQMALVLRRISNAEYRPEYIDRAIIEFTAAIYHYEQAGHERYCATNLLMLRRKKWQFTLDTENIGLLHPFRRYAVFEK